MRIQEITNLPSLAPDIPEEILFLPPIESGKDVITVRTLRQGQVFQITRLTSLKRLCQEPSVAHRCVTYLARETMDPAAQGNGRAKDRETKSGLVHR